tara:strand:- start:142 stop:360 length:219 start_codon:yes stop_codon:yes gene_type:complete
MYERVVATAAPIKEYWGMRIRFRSIFKSPAAVVFAKIYFVFPIASKVDSFTPVRIWKRKPSESIESPTLAAT